MQPVTTSLFELFKIGPGPSSSHTIGPMEAALQFRRFLLELPEATLQRATRLEVELFGSLSATGHGHGTDTAILAGLLGWQPAKVNPADMESLRSGDCPRALNLRGRAIPFSADTIQYGPVVHEFPYNNTLVMRLFGAEHLLLETEFYSVGGGFIQWKGWNAPQIGHPKYPYHNMASLRQQIENNNLCLAELMWQNEMAISGAARGEILKRLDETIEVMVQAVARGLSIQGVLPGPIGLMRKAAALHHRAIARRNSPGQFLSTLNAYALAVSEENAAGHIVVTAPTLGSAGVVPAALAAMKHMMHFPKEILRESLLAAAAIGFLAKHNASIAGAEVGCQGEVGVASAMAAAMFAHAHGFNHVVAANAAEIALEHHLGMTCDPVAGCVQIPCIERNAMGAVKAYNAFLLASEGDWSSQKISFDQVVQVMLATGRDMCTKYKETSEGGLAVSKAEC